MNPYQRIAHRIAGTDITDMQFDFAENRYRLYTRPPSGEGRCFYFLDIAAVHYTPDEDGAGWREASDCHLACFRNVEEGKESEGDGDLQHRPPAHGSLHFTITGPLLRLFIQCTDAKEQSPTPQEAKHFCPRQP